MFLDKAMLPKNTETRQMKRILAAAIALAAFSTAFAGDDIKVSGWVDFYYQYDFNKPAVGAPVAGRGYDFTQNNFSLANAVVRVQKGATAKNPYGFTFDFGTGRNFEVNAGLDNSQAAAVTTNAVSPTKLFQQGFLTYAAADGTTWDFGKFNTWIGYESVYAVDNMNYSISPLFNYSQPFWHVGMRMTKPVNESTTVGLYVVNGWNISDDDNGSKTLGLSYSKVQSEKLTTSLNWIGGNETGANNGIGFAAAGQSNVSMFDFVGTYKVSDKHTLAVNADWATAKRLDAGAADGKWSGYSIFSNHNLSDTRDFGLRYSVIDDGDGLRGLGGRLSSITATYAIKTAEAASLRFELRQDQSNFNLFAGDNARNHMTLTVAHTIKF